MTIKVIKMRSLSQYKRKIQIFSLLKFLITKIRFKIRVVLETRQEIQPTSP